MTAQIGTTISTLALKDLGLSVKPAVQIAFRFNFSYLRLGVYWNQVEQNSGEFDFGELKEILNWCEQANQKVVLTVGAKAPRWPEFHWPDWLENKNIENRSTQDLVFNLIEKTVQELKDFKCITHWQVENEPLDPSGPDNSIIPLSFLQQEVELVRKLDSRPVLLTAWGNDLIRRGNFPKLEKLADVVGVDLYYRQFVKKIAGRNFYTGLHQSNTQLKNLIIHSFKPVWAAELQAEPWEADQETYLSENTPSISPDRLKKYLQQTANLPVSQVLLWGFEYWLWRLKQKDDAYLKTVRQQMI